MFLKLEEDYLKNEGDRFLIIYLISDQIDPKKIALHMFVKETFYKSFNISKV